MFDTAQLNCVDAPWLMRLPVETELVYFDRPLCVLCKNELGHFYLGHFLDGSPAGNELWFLTPVAAELVERLLVGRIPLRTALESAPEAFRYICELSATDDEVYAFSAAYSSCAIDSLADFLPTESLVFFEDEFSDYLAESFDSQTDYAHQRMTDVIDLRFVGEGVTPLSFPVETESPPE